MYLRTDQCKGTNKKMVIEKITTRLKYVIWTNSQIKKPLQEPRNQTDQTPDITQKTRTHVFKFLTPLTQPMEKTLNLQGYKYVYKPRKINVVFSQCGS